MRSRDVWWQAYLAALTGLAAQTEPSRHRDTYSEEAVTLTAGWLADAALAAFKAHLDHHEVGAPAGAAAEQLDAGSGGDDGEAGETAGCGHEPSP